ncbi:N(6)-adenine-specific DNA methyltransferase 2 [Phytophthora megakarya]|uniref:N(6)-adenine-specific DNA methyltransferase 2 n=1 Tax=Phytophthora megakarya TaxID=4795 RepID=A0A225W9D2_9STRA|nr:N(6)-adenine-specific DNA methyltransferase 2 [Phytophthora megakarya]
MLERHQEEGSPVSEAFRLSQFWYDDKTGRQLVLEAIDHSSSELKIVLVSLSPAYRDILKIQREKEN